MKMNQSLTMKLLLIFVSIIAVGGIVVSTVLYLQFQKDQKIIKSPTVSSQLDAKDLIAKISKIYLLPKGEDPTIATVSDYKKLQGLAFFKDAQNGDKVLIYPKEQIAILYSPKLNMILSVALVNTEPSVTPVPKKK